MPFLNAYICGWKQIKNYWQLVVILFTTNLLIALLISLSLQSALVSRFGHSQVARELLVKLHLNHFIELFTSQPLLFQQLTDNFFYSMFIYLALTLFFAGGAIRIFATRNLPFSLHFFLAASLENWARMIRLFLFRLLGAVLLGLFWLALYRIGSTLLDTNNEVLHFRVIVFELGITGVFFLFLSVFWEYTGIILVLEGPQFFSALKKTVAFFRGNVFNTVSLYLLILGTGLLFTGLYVLLSEIFNWGNEFSVGLIFLVQQFYILSRTSVRLLFYAGQVRYYISQNPPDFSKEIFSETENR
jgi:hypothetical protein